MGSLADGTPCVYCGDELAGCIPDGAAGPVGRACLELLLARGGLALVQVRLLRKARSWLAISRGQANGQASSDAAPAVHGFRRILDVEAVAACVASFCIWA